MHITPTISGTWDMGGDRVGATWPGRHPNSAEAAAPFQKGEASTTLMDADEVGQQVT